MVWVLCKAHCKIPQDNDWAKTYKFFLKTGYIGAGWKQIAELNSLNGQTSACVIE